MSVFFLRGQVSESPRFAVFAMFAAFAAFAVFAVFAVFAMFAAPQASALAPEALNSALCPHWPRASLSGDSEAILGAR